MARLHELKIEADFFTPMIQGLKKAEIRYNDREFKTYDLILFTEVNYEMQPKQTRKALTRITHILYDYECTVLVKKHCLISIEVIEHYEVLEPTK